MREPRLLLFDLDDTIFDHVATCRAALSRLRAERTFLRRRSLGDLWDEYHRLVDLTHSEVALGRRSAEDARTERWERMGRFCGTTLTPGEASSAARRYRTYYQSLRRPVAGAPELLARLHRSATIGIISNNEGVEQEEKIRHLGIGPSVDILVVSGNEGVAKPDPRIFRIAFERAGARPAESVMIGDSWENDVLGATRAGVRPIWFNRFRLPRPDSTPAEELTALRPFCSVERVLYGGAPRAGLLSSDAKERAL